MQEVSALKVNSSSPFIYKTYNPSVLGWQQEREPRLRGEVGGSELRQKHRMSLECLVEPGSLQASSQDVASLEGHSTTGTSLTTQ